MTRTISMLSVVAALTAPVWAGKRIQSESVDLSTNKVSPREILLDAGRLKIDSGDSVVMFLTNGGNRMVLLDKKRNEFRVMDQAAMDAIGGQLAGATSQLEAAMKNMPPEQRAKMEALLKGKLGGKQIATPVGATYTAKGPGTVSGFRCTNYDGAENGVKVTEICAASMADLKLGPADFAVMDQMREYMAGMQKGLQGSPVAGMMTEGSLTKPGVNGFPIQTTMINGGKPVTREQVKSVTSAVFTDADFSTGSAKQVEMPVPGARAKARVK